MPGPLGHRQADGPETHMLIHNGGHEPYGNSSENNAMQNYGSGFAASNMSNLPRQADGRGTNTMVGNGAFEAYGNEVDNYALHKYGDGLPSSSISNSSSVQQNSSSQAIPIQGASKPGKPVGVGKSGRKAPGRKGEARPPSLFEAGGAIDQAMDYGRCNQPTDR